MPNELETFEEYWKNSPGLQGLDRLPAELVLQIAKACYVAGQSSALKWANKTIPQT